MSFVTAMRSGVAKMILNPRRVPKRCRASTWKNGLRPVLNLQIAATARRHGLIVATLNAKHFAGLPGVQLAGAVSEG